MYTFCLLWIPSSSAVHTVQHGVTVFQSIKLYILLTQKHQHQKSSDEKVVRDIEQL